MCIINIIFSGVLYFLRIARVFDKVLWYVYTLSGAEKSPVSQCYNKTWATMGDNMG